MKKRDYIYYFLLLATAAAGCWAGNFAGGILAGITITVFSFAALGKYLSIKAAATLEKRITDHIIHSKNQAND